MLILPAIDLQDGVCVRLLRGDFDTATRYGDPAAQLAAFAQAGAQWVHIVDLDGARAREPVQHEFVAALAAQTRLRIQCGGGVRDRGHVQRLLHAGVARVVIGSIAARAPDEVAAWLEEFGAERVCIALDVRRAGGAWQVAADGWSTGAGAALPDLLDRFDGVARHVLVTDISRDGALTGPNVALMSSLAAQWPELAFQASGGVARLHDLGALRDAGARAAIVGRALYERRFTLEDALAL